MIQVGDAVLAHHEHGPGRGACLVFGSVLHVDADCDLVVVRLLRNGNPGPIFSVTVADAEWAVAFLEGYLDEAAQAQARAA